MSIRCCHFALYGKLAENKITPLSSIPYHPQYNARAEHAVKEVKTGLPVRENMKYLFLKDFFDGQIKILNCMLPRERFYGKTSEEVFYETIPVKDFDRNYFMSQVNEVEYFFGQMYDRRGGGKRIHRLAVEEVLKEQGLCSFRKSVFVK